MDPALVNKLSKLPIEDKIKILEELNNRSSLASVNTFTKSGQTWRPSNGSRNLFRKLSYNKTLSTSYKNVERATRLTQVQTQVPGPMSYKPTTTKRRGPKPKMKPPHLVDPASDSDTSLAEPERKASPHRGLFIPRVCLPGGDSVLQYHLATDASDEELGGIPLQMESRAIYASFIRSRELSPTWSPARFTPRPSGSDSDEDGVVSRERYPQAYNQCHEA